MDFFTINPINLVRTLSLSLDLVVDGTNMHQLRTAVICKYIAEEMCFEQSRLQTLLNAALLHDIGAAPDHNEQVRLATPGEEARLGKAIFPHAEEGWKLLKDSLCFHDSALPVRHHHDYWEGGNPSGTRGEAIPLESRIIHLADRVEINVKKSLPILGQRKEIAEKMEARGGTQFDPEVVDTFLRCSRCESFWLDVMHPSFVDQSLSQIYGESTMFTAKQLMNVAGMFATLIDRKSIFTATHSRSVANVAVLLAKHHGFSRNELYMVKIAGYLHDLGKLSVHSDILEKPGPLEPHEVEVMRQHTYYTYRLLCQLDGMRQIAQWAAFHHETLDGRGYPFQLTADELPLGSRIMAVADIFVALAEDRPYRKRLESRELRNLMANFVRNGKIDPHIVESLYDLYDQADAIVLSPLAAGTLEDDLPECADA